MNFKQVLRIVGFSLLLEGLALLPPLLVALMFREDPAPFLKTMGLLLGCGLLLVFLKSGGDFYAREGFFTVGLIWILFGVFGALPFWFSGEFGSYVDCFFESISGFTTTGASILPDVERISKGLLFWRSFTHWLGGMGVLVLTAALLPFLGISSSHLIRAESPGPVKSKLVPRTAQSSKILYTIYLGLTILQTVLLRIAGMPWFDAIVHAFGTAGTGGFGIKNNSVAYYQSPAIEIIFTVFLILFALNFTVYFLLLTGKVRQALASDELRFFLSLVALSSILIAFNILPTFDSFGEAFRFALFQVASIISSAGFSTADYDLWPEFSRMLLVLLMFIGACAGSTGGGIKCSRILILARSGFREIRSIIHPRSVSVVRLDGVTLSEDTIRTTHVFFFLYFLVCFPAALIVGRDNFSFASTITAVVSCISNIGPGLEQVGPSGNYAAFSDISKLVLSFCMIVGRLEFFPILVLFSRNAWKRS